ncbi:alpha/beta fold hydrolase [Microterricola viridarii]|uniref:Pimeloyl-ACP methyl ester carboxylesterase n=1 Tax=Microterricola viridarii TaxID=412690 RepID=A0A1H1YVA4_9MICO|nr:alpha/beta hydrolase [Microterricola viridarii]SDT25313.1 Pimeloyl-ACP methyl ester carboxylesterase [Microterricola viridarii]
MALSMQTFSPAGGEVAAQTPPVVFLHGFASSGTADWVAGGWHEAATASGRTAVVVDLPGHGANASAVEGAAGTTAVVRALSEAVDAAIAAAGAEQADVVAYSLGARLAWELPAANPRVRRLVLGGLSPFDPFAQLDTSALRAAAAGTAEPDSPLTGMMAQMVSAPGNDPAALIALIDGLASEPFLPGRTAGEATPSGAPQLPTLFVAGSDDMMTGGIEGLVALVPDAALLRVPGDHHGALGSAEFRAAALDFLS